jgi:flagellar biosynthesis GTPase FlhF
MEMKTSYGHGSDITTYPINAPYIHFISSILHVNISPNGGSICLDILKDKSKWSPQNSFDTIIQNILLLFNEPNNGSPYNGNASKIWVDCEKEYKALKNASMTVAETEEIYMKCFDPFIKEARHVMLTNNFKRYSQWFPELDKADPAYQQRLVADKEELDSLEEMFAKLKNARKAAKAAKEAAAQEPNTQEPNTQEPNTQEPNTQEAAAQKANTQEAAAQEPQPVEQKKNRWAKYQKKNDA